MIGDVQVLYCDKITVPASTSKDNALSKKIIIKEDVITSISIYFPPGHACLTGVSFWYGEDMIFPAKEYDWVRGNDESVNAKVYFILPEVPGEIIVKAFNEDTTYTHTVYFRVEALPRDIALWELNISKLTSMFRDIYPIWRMPVRVLG